MTVKQQPNLPFSACGTALSASPNLSEAFVRLDVFCQDSWPFVRAGAVESSFVSGVAGAS